MFFMDFLRCAANRDDEGQGDKLHGGALAIERAKPKVQRPRLYKVIMLNDDYTPMDFVVHILETFFYMHREQATQIMIKVHTEGRAVCGVYSRDVAETKAEQVNVYSHQNEHPLRCNIEAAEYDESDENS
jgi:ATP-dependent Clp protease adaptor protein ClpS